MAQRPFLVIEQQRGAPPGLLGDWLAGRSLPTRIVRPAEGEPLPDPADVMAVAVLGSERGVYEDEEWIRREVAFLRAAAERSLPVLGLCFGGQALAAALGARVAPATTPERGWLELDTVAPERVAPGPWLAWHNDEFELPAGATTLARSRHAIHAFALGPHLGLQFHPEVTPGIIDGWIRHAEATGRAVARADGLRAATRFEAPGARRRALRLFDAWWETIASRRARASRD